MPHKRPIRWSMLSTALLSVVRFPSAVSAFSVGSVQRARQSSRATLTTTSYSSAPDTSQSNLKANLLTISLPELEELVSAWVYPKYRAGQIQGWVREKGVVDFEGMKNLPKALRETLKEHVQFGALHLEVQLESKDGTVKRAYKLWDGQLIESVLMPYEDGRNTACISSQAGCAMACEFCATGQMGFARQLTPDEIFEQVARFHTELKGQGERLSNIVFMGMGEPMLNYDNVFAAIDILNAEWGLTIGKRHITVSTSGYLANINRLIEEERYINLAFSVGSADPKTRVKVMPIEKRNPIMVVSRALNQYLKMHNRKLTLEYVLLDGVNESDYDIQSLINLSKYLNAKINLINLNPHSKIPYEPVSSKKLVAIKQKIQRSKCLVTVRFKKGQDIAAACGQLGESIIK